MAYVGRQRPDMDVALGIGQADAMLLEQEPQAVEHVGADIADAAFRVADPCQYLVLERIIAKLISQTVGLGLFNTRGDSRAARSISSCASFRSLS